MLNGAFAQVKQYPYAQWRSINMAEKFFECGDNGPGCPFGEDGYFIRSLVCWSSLVPAKVFNLNCRRFIERVTLLYL